MQRQADISPHTVRRTPDQDRRTPSPAITKRPGQRSTGKIPAGRRPGPLLGDEEVLQRRAPVISSASAPDGSARGLCRAGRSRNLCDRNCGTPSGVLRGIPDRPKSGGQMRLWRSSIPPLSRQLHSAFQGRFHSVDAGELSATSGESARCDGVHVSGLRPHDIENRQVRGGMVAHLTGRRERSDRPLAGL